MSDTPRTDALTDADFKNIDEDMETATLQAYNRLHDLCAELERELAEAREEISDLQGDVEAWKRETMIANARLRGEKHPDDNGAISTKEIIPKLQRELAEAREQRDTLAEALRGPVNAAKAADSPSWSEPGESGWYVEEYERTNAKNWLANTKNWLPEAIEALAAVKGGSND